MATTARILRQSSWTLFVLIRDGRCAAIEYFETLTAVECRKLISFIERTAELGPLGYREDRNRKLSEHIFELKPTSQVRLAYFFDGPKRLVITHGFTKKSGKTPPAEIARAQTLRAEYLGGSR